MRAFHWAALVFVVACSDAGDSSQVTQSGRAPDPDGKLFTLMPSSITGIRFENRLRETQEMNVFTYRNFYNGGGVGIGDLTGDSLPEVVLTANQGGTRLYRNEGAFRFRDVTRASGVTSAKNAWTTGVTLADVDGDGRLDIYICRAGEGEPSQRGNELWINQGVDGEGAPTFREMAREYGVADEGYSIHAAFLDVDRDGDLDLFVINNSPKPVSSFGIENVRDTRNPYGGGRLYRNDGRRFTDVSAAAGIHSPEVAFALGLAVGDVNRDGWPDIYVANDFFERDYLYMNRGDGTFAEHLDDQMPVVSYFSMGLDIADVDNDLWPDVYTTDMLPEDEVRLKTTSAFEAWELYQQKVRHGYHHQLMRNMLQRNNGDGTFSDIGEISGVARTDWSWSALVADMDLDGRKDIFVTNGLAKDVTSQDYVAFLGNEETMKEVTSGGTKRADFVKLTNAMTATPLRNFAFRNDGRMRFSSQATAWGLDAPSFSNGAAYGDLDGDGALDLVVNNVNGESFVYRNNARSVAPDHHFLRVRPDGEGRNRFGVGARVTLHARSGPQLQEQAPARGYQSSVDYVLVFGLGRDSTVDSLRVDWPDGRVSVVRGLAGDTLIRVSQRDASRVPASPGPARDPRTLLEDVTGRAGPDHPHRENAFVDFDRERLLPKLLSTEGPQMAVADVNADGRDDVYIGGAKEQPRRLLLQQRDGGFASSNEAAFQDDLMSEDVGAAFFDANGDGSPDLYVVSGGNEFSDRAEPLEDRLYLNDGRGNFRKAKGSLPSEFDSGSRVVPADYDGDGDVDLFVGGRVVPWRYGVAPRSRLLRNDGRGRFSDVTAQLAPTLSDVGMVTDAVWNDTDGDGQLDLVVVGEWMPITMFRNAGGGRLQRAATRGLEKSNGWWNRIVPGDFDRDGRMDFVVGNLGLNSRLRASESEPVTMYVSDFDRNGFVEQIIAYYNGGASYPLPLRDDLVRTLPYLKTRFSSYKDYAHRKMADVIQPDELANALVLHAYTFASALVRAKAGGSYELVPLPVEAQLSSVYGLLAEDVDGDRNLDVLLAGNFYGFKPEIGRLTAGRGLVLRGDGRGGFTPMPASASGFVVPGEARDIQRVRTARGSQYVVSRNNDRALVFRRASY